MASWKKVLVSGSNIHVNEVTASSLTNDNLIVAGTGGALESSGLTYNGTALGLGSANVTTTGTLSAGATDVDSLTVENLTDNTLIVVGTGGAIEDATGLTFDGTTLSGQAVSASIQYISGAFVGDGSGLTGLGTDLSISGDTGGDTVFLSTDTLNFNGTGVSTTITDNNVAIDVDYGSTASTSVQGNTTITINGTANEVEITGTAAQALGGAPSYTIGLPNDVTIGNDLTVTGDLFVQGTTTTINTTNLLVEDKFILLNSGSANPDEGGLVIDAGSGTGFAYFYEADQSRWGFNDSIAHTATTANAEAFAAAVIDIDVAGHTDQAAYQYNGNIKIESGEIFIYS